MISITGMGCVTCVGTGPDVLFQQALNENSGIIDGLGKMDIQTPGDESRAIHFSMMSINQAMAQAGWTELRPDDGLIVATTTGLIDIWENPLIEFLQTNISSEEFAPFLKIQPLHSLTKKVAEHLEFKGRDMLITTACTAATQAIAMGSHWLRQGLVKRCLVGGVDLLSKLTVNGFRSLQLLNPNPATPFDVNRNGINLAEGAGFLCLESDVSRPLAHILGSGTSSDAFHMTGPEPEGQGCFRAMSAALRDAGLNTDQIDWIHAHGTGSRQNDSAEGAAIGKLFPQVAKRRPWVSSTKNIHGHTLGASGAIEAILCVKALENKTILKTSGLKISDVDVRHPDKHFSFDLKTVLKNTLGFGGNNASLILGAP